VQDATVCATDARWATESRWINKPSFHE